MKYLMRTIKCRNYTNYDQEKMFKDINDFDWQPVYQATNVNKVVDYFNTEIRKVFDEHAPMIEKHIKGRLCEWLNQDVKSDMNNRDYHFIKHVKQTRIMIGQFIEDCETGVTTKSINI